MEMFNTALITGATSGIGKALSYELAQHGINLILTGRNENVLNELSHELGKQIAVETLVADLNQPADRQKLVQYLHALTPDLVINNAGLGLYGSALTHTTAEQLNLLEVNAVAVVELTLEAARALKAKHKKGTILNVSSSAAFQVFPNLSLYAASKAFVNHFSQSFDQEMHSYGIRILAACPGMVQTEFQVRAGGREDGQLQFGSMSAEYVAKKIWKQIQEQQPLLIIDWKYRLLTTLSKFLTKEFVARFLANRIAERMQNKQDI